MDAAIKKSLWKRQEKGTTLLFLDDQWIKWVQLEGLTPPRVIKQLFAYPIREMSEQELIDFFQEQVLKANLNETQFLVATPSYLSTIRLLSVPSSNPQEIREMMDLQTEKLTPYAKEEILSDFKILGTDATGHSRVFLTVVREETVLRACRLIENVHCTLDRVGVDLEGFIHWFEHVAKKAGDFPKSGATLLIDIDSDITTIIALEKNIPYFNRGVSLGARLLKEYGTQGVSRLIEEIQASLDALNEEGHALQVTHAVITGLAKNIPTLPTLIEEELHLTAKFIPTFEYFSIKEEVLSTTKELQQTSYTSLLGLALHPGELDFTPEPIRLRKNFEARARALVKLGCLLFAGVILLSVLIFGHTYADQRYHASLKKAYEATFQDVQHIEQGMDYLKIIQSHLEDREVLLNTFKELNRHTSSSIEFRAVDFIRGEEIRVRGISNQMSKVFEFATTLEQSPLFRDIETRRASKRKVEGKDVAEFEIICRLINEKGR